MGKIGVLLAFFCIFFETSFAQRSILSELTFSKDYPPTISVDFRKILAAQNDPASHAAQEASFAAQKFFGENGLDTTKECSAFFPLIEKWETQGVSSEILIHSWASTKKVLQAQESALWIANNPKASWGVIKSQKFAKNFENQLLRTFVVQSRSGEDIRKFLYNAKRIGELSANDGQGGLILSLRKEQRKLASQLIPLADEYPELLNYFDLVQAGKQKESNAYNVRMQNRIAWENKWSTKMGKQALGVGEVVYDLFGVYGNYLTGGGVTGAGNFISENQQALNSSYWFLPEHQIGSVFGSDADFSEKGGVQLFFEANPIVQVGGVIGVGMEGINESYEWWKRLNLGNHSPDILRAKYPLLAISDASFDVAQIATGFALLLSGNAGTLSHKIGLMGRASAVSVGLSGTTAIGHELYMNGSHTNNFSFARVAESTIQGSSNSILFMGGLSSLASQMVSKGTSVRSAIATGRTIDITEASGSAPQSTFMMSQARNWQQYLGASLIISANVLDTTDVTLAGAFKKLSGYKTENSASEIKKKTERVVSQLPGEQTGSDMFTGESTFENTFQKFDKMVLELSNRISSLELVGATHEIESVRDEAIQSGDALNLKMISLFFNQDIYSLLKEYSESKDAKHLNVEKEQMMNRYLAEFEDNGMSLNRTVQNELKSAFEKLVNLTSQIDKNITNDEGKTSWTKEDLRGVPESMLEELQQENGRYIVRGKVAHEYISVMENASDAEVRRSIYTKRATRGKEQNKDLIEEVIRTRTQIKDLVEEKSWFDYRVKHRMAKNSDNVKAFLDDLNDRLEIKFNEEKQLLADMKGRPLEPWDVLFYENKFVKERYALDKEELRRYFPMDQTLKGVFDNISLVFGLKFTLDNSYPRWNDKVQVYKVSDSKSHKTLGYIALDLYPREGKYGHFASFGAHTGVGKNPEYQTLNAIVGNFPEAQNGSQALLTHDQLLTMFHELGHALHSVLSNTSYANIAGTSVVHDFVEVPSQLLEHWGWDYDVLKTFARDPNKPHDVFPAEALEKLKAAKNGLSGHFYKRQIAQAQMDYFLHTFSEPQLVSHLYEKTNEIIGRYTYSQPNEVASLASFGHFFHGYDAGYYSYLWSEVIEMDIASEFEKSEKGYLNPELGMKLRKEIYEKGAARPEEESVKAFLGREWNSDAFLNSLTHP